MADDEKDENVNESSDAEAAEEAAPVEDAAPEPETAEPEVETPEPEAETPEPETPEPEPEPEPETPEPETPEPEPEAEPALHPKEARRRRRSAHAGETRPERSAEDRHAEREDARRVKAQRRRAYRTKARAKAAERRADAPAPEPPPAAPPSTGRPKVRQGIVVSDRADKTITVRVAMTRRHRRYEKTIRSSSTLHAHDERNEAGVGDTVRVVESRPLSRTKRWRLVEVLERAR